MTEVRTSSLCERPCADIDKVYDPANLAEAWKRVRENKGSAGIDGLTVAGFEREISAFHLSETGWFNRPWCRR